MTQYMVRKSELIQFIEVIHLLFDLIVYNWSCIVCKEIINFWPLGNDFSYEYEWCMVPTEDYLKVYGRRSSNGEQVCIEVWDIDDIF